MKNEQKNKCLNCKNYVEYYRISGSAFMPLPRGHCAKQRLTAKQQRSFPFIEACETWEPREELKKQRSEDITSALDRIAVQLDQIRQILAAEQPDCEDE